MLALGKTQERAQSMTRSSGSFYRAREKYLEQNMRWNRMNQAPSHRLHETEQFEKSYTSNLAYFERVQNKAVELFQGLQLRGTTAHFTALDPAIVRSDGRSIRVHIGTGHIAAEPRIIAAPEESLNAALTLKMTNPGAQPLLPGTVARYRDGAFLGVTIAYQVDYPPSLVFDVQRKQRSMPPPSPSAPRPPPKYDFEDHIPQLEHAL